MCKYLSPTNCGAHKHVYTANTKLFIVLAVYTANTKLFIESFTFCWCRLGGDVPTSVTY